MSLVIDMLIAGGSWSTDDIFVVFLVIDMLKPKGIGVHPLSSEKVIRQIEEQRRTQLRKSIKMFAS